MSDHEIAIGRMLSENAQLRQQLADAMRDHDLEHARLADLSLQIGELHTTIGYQDAMLARMRQALDTAYNALMSYAHDNSAPDLAAEVAAHLLETIESVGKE